MAEEGVQAVFGSHLDSCFRHQLAVRFRYSFGSCGADEVHLVKQCRQFENIDSGHLSAAELDTRLQREGPEPGRVYDSDFFFF